MHTLSDNELVRQCQQQLPYETAAFEELMNRYKDRVYAKVLSMVNNPEDARDLTQDIFIKIYQNIHAFRFESQFSTWVYTVTVNTCLNHREKSQRRPGWWLFVDYDELKDEERLEQELFYLIGQSLEREDLRKQIQKALKRLSPASRQIIELRFMEEMELKEIANHLGIGLSAAKMRLKRARAEFKAEFSKLRS